MKMTKGVSLNDMLARLSPERRAKVEAGTAALIAQEYALRAARKAAGKTQVAMAKAMGVTQGEVSRIEAGGDMLLSTLGRYVQAAGFVLELVKPDTGARLRLDPHIAVAALARGRSPATARATAIPPKAARKAANGTSSLRAAAAKGIATRASRRTRSASATSRAR